MPLSHQPPRALAAVGVCWLAGFDFEIKVMARIPGRCPINRGTLRQAKTPKNT
jgi:hypothetical protein